MGLTYSKIINLRVSLGACPRRSGKGGKTEKKGGKNEKKGGKNGQKERLFIL